MERTFPRPFSETFWISKNEDFNGPYLENGNGFLKNSFETIFRASKSCDRSQLVSAFQLTFNDITSPALPIFHNLELLTLADIHNLHVVSFVYECFNGLSPSYFCDQYCKLWNSVPAEIRSSTSVTKFKSELKKYYITFYLAWSPKLSISDLNLKLYTL